MAVFPVSAMLPVPGPHAPFDVAPCGSWGWSLDDSAATVTAPRTATVAASIPSGSNANTWLLTRHSSRTTPVLRPATTRKFCYVTHSHSAPPSRTHVVSIRVPGESGSAGRGVGPFALVWLAQNRHHASRSAQSRIVTTQTAREAQLAVLVVDNDWRYWSWILIVGTGRTD